MEKEFKGIPLKQRKMLSKKGIYTRKNYNKKVFLTGSRDSAAAKAIFFFACVVLLGASFLITLVEAIIVQLMDSEFEAMLLYIVSIAALLAAFATWKHASKINEFVSMS